LWIESNSALTSLAGLEGLTSIPGVVKIWGNNSLTSLAGLDNLTYIEGNLDIRSNPALTSLNGLESLTTIGEYLMIGFDYAGNSSLANLSGLLNLNSIGGGLHIRYNPSLTSLAGLDNIDPGTINYLNITHNTLLTDCSVQSICDYLLAPDANVMISSNDPGCNNRQQVEISCGFCLSEGYVFNNQSKIDNFQNAYPGCTEIAGNVTIQGPGITNLVGLSVLTDIGGDFYIDDNPNLTSLSGLDNLNSIGGSLSIAYNASLSNLTGLESLNIVANDLIIQVNQELLNLTGIEGLNVITGHLSIYGNPLLSNLAGLENITSIGGSCLIGFNEVLTNLLGLENLTFIGGDLVIGASFSGSSFLTTLAALNNLSVIGGNIEIYGHDYLTSLSGLNNLTSIGGNINIENNSALNCLTGIDNITAGSVSNLYIKNNSALSTCDVTSICEYLAAPNGYTWIENNAPGCNSPEEVIEACLISVEEITPPENFSIFPNPANDRLTVHLLLEKPEPVIITVLNSTGQQMVLLADDQPKAGDYRTEFDISKWPAGVYWCRMQAGQANISQKFIKIN